MRAQRRAAPAAKAKVRPEDAALDALARALAPRVAEILRANGSASDDDFSDLLAATGYELDREGGAT